MCAGSVRRNTAIKYAIQVVITTDEGQTETREIAGVEREELSLTTLGLTLAWGKPSSRPCRQSWWSSR
jgi:hypothetical protein